MTRIGDYTGFTCKDCPDRHPCCHANCEKYLKEKELYNAKKEHIRKLYPPASWTRRRSENYTKQPKRESELARRLNRTRRR